MARYVSLRCQQPRAYSSFTAPPIPRLASHSRGGSNDNPTRALAALRRFHSTFALRSTARPSQSYFFVQVSLFREKVVPRSGHSLSITLDSGGFPPCSLAALFFYPRRFRSPIK